MTTALLAGIAEVAGEAKIDQPQEVAWIVLPDQDTEHATWATLNSR